MHMEIAARVVAEIRAEIAYQRVNAGDLAEVLGISQSAVSARLNDRTPFTLGEFVQTADWLNVSADELMRRAHEKRVAS